MADYELDQEILGLIKTERQRQIDKYPDEQSNDPYLWSVILSEELGEVNRAILERDETQLMKELTDLVAVGVAWLEDLNDN